MLNITNDFHKAQYGTYKEKVALLNSPNEKVRSLLAKHGDDWIRLKLMHDKRATVRCAVAAYGNKRMKAVLSADENADVRFYANLK